MVVIEINFIDEIPEPQYVLHKMKITIEAMIIVVNEGDGWWCPGGCGRRGMVVSDWNLHCLPSRCACLRCPFPCSEVTLLFRRFGFVWGLCSPGAAVSAPGFCVPDSDPLTLPLSSVLDCMLALHFVPSS